MPSRPVAIEQAAELVHTVKDLDEVIEVGSDTTYEIRVKNSGTKAATNVRVAALMPPGMAAVSGDGPTRAGGDATQIAFAPLERLNPREEVVYQRASRKASSRATTSFACSFRPTTLLPSRAKRARACIRTVDPLTSASLQGCPLPLVWLAKPP